MESYKQPETTPPEPPRQAWLSTHKLLGYGFLVVIAILVIGGIYAWQYGGNTDPPPVNPGQTYSTPAAFTKKTDNEPAYKNISRCPVESQEIIEKYNIDPRLIEGCQSKEFAVNDTKTSFVHIEYGIANDCLSGCFFSHFCTISSGNEDFPYSFIFNNEEEDILEIEEEVDFGIEFTSNDYGRDKLTGLNHPIVLKEDFLTFKDNEILHGGDTEQGYKLSEFRWCK